MAPTEAVITQVAFSLSGCTVNLDKSRHLFDLLSLDCAGLVLHLQFWMVAAVSSDWGIYIHSNKVISNQEVHAHYLVMLWKVLSYNKYYSPLCMAVKNCHPPAKWFPKLP